MKNFRLLALAVLTFSALEVFAEGPTPFETPEKIERKLEKPKVEETIDEEAPKLTIPLFLELDPTVKENRIEGFFMQETEVSTAIPLINDWTQKNFVMDPAISKKINVLGPKKVSVEQAYLGFLSALYSNGYALEESQSESEGESGEEGQVEIRIVEQDEPDWIESDQEIKLPKEHPIITEIFPVRFLKVEALGANFAKISLAKMIFVLPSTNSLVVTDARHIVGMLKEILITIDRKQMKGRITLVSFTRTEPENYLQGLLDDHGYVERKVILYAPFTIRPNKFAEPPPDEANIYKILLHDERRALVVVSDKPGLDIVIHQLEQVEDSEALWPTPALSFAVPTGYGANWGDGFVAGSYARGGGEDAELAAGFGLFSSVDNLGLSVVFSIPDTLNDSHDGLDFGSYGLSLKLHRYLGKGFGIAVGKINVLFTGDEANKDDSVYASLSKFFRLKKVQDEWFSAAMLTAGIGNGRFRTASDLASDTDNPSFYASGGIRIHQPISFIAEWGGHDFNIASSITPIPDLNLIFTLALVNMFETSTLIGDGRQLVLTLSLGFTFA